MVTKSGRVHLVAAASLWVSPPLPPPPADVVFFDVVFFDGFFDGFFVVLFDGLFVVLFVGLFVELFVVVFTPAGVVVGVFLVGAVVGLFLQTADFPSLFARHIVLSHDVQLTHTPAVFLASCPSFQAHVVPVVQFAVHCTHTAAPLSL